MVEIDDADVRVAAARHQVGLLPREELPMLAAEWLAAGLDSPLLRELAGLSRSDGSITWLWPAVLAELGVDVPTDDPRRVLAPWAARLVLDGERDPAWLARTLLRGIDTEQDSDLVPLLYELDHCLELIELPVARSVRDIASVLTTARTEAHRIVWLLARLDPREDPPPLTRDHVLVEAAARALRDDLRRVTRRRWTLEEDRPGSWVLRDPNTSIALDLDPLIDPDALPPEIGPEQVTQEFADEATAHVGGAVLRALDASGARLRCRAHAAPLTICAGQWTCDSDPGHDIDEVGTLRRRDAELHIGG